MDKKNVFIGVAWPYVNGTLHIGHYAGYLLPADICARFNRNVGNNVLMVSGSDCYGTPVTVEADKKGVPPEEIVEKYHSQDVELFLNTLGLTYDLYSKTDHPNHTRVTQQIFLTMLKKDLIFVDEMMQYYSPTEDKFLPDRYVVGECGFCGFKDARSDQCDNCGKLLTHKDLKNPQNNLTGDSVELKETQHYFVNWPELEEFLKEHVEDVSGNWKKWVSQETKGWLNEGLKSRAITRDISWGIPLPKDKMPEDKIIDNIDDKRIYVWFEAVIGYLSGSKLWAEKNNGDWEKFWYDSKSDNKLKHYYFMGKDNLVFHTLFWPGQLNSFDENLHLPDVQSINMFLNYDGQQFSKSRGIVVEIKDIVEKYGNDTVRFYLTLTMPEKRDSSFNWRDFEEKVNGILVANLGNFIHRVLSLGKGENESVFNGLEVSNEVLSEIKLAFENVYSTLDNCEFRKYLSEILKLSSYGNNLIDENELWNLKSEDENKYYQVLYDLLAIIISLGYISYPLLPTSAGKLFDMLSLENDFEWSKENVSKLIEAKLKEINLPEDPRPLFNKIEIT